MARRSAGGLSAVRVDGLPRGSFTAEQIAGEGLPVTLGAEWRAAVIELE